MQKKDANTYIDNLKFEIEQKDKELEEMNQVILSKDRQISNVKAREFDRIDVYKKQAELETRVSVL